MTIRRHMVRIRPRRPAEPPPAQMQPTDAYQRDDGRYALGLADEGPGFETIPFARHVWLRHQTRHLPRWVRPG